jgi:hypothetical protein
MKIIIYIFIFFFTTLLPGIEVKPFGTINLFLDDSFMQLPTSFCVTQDDVIFVTDTRAGDIKVFDNKGKLVNTWGRKGPGPNEFLKPYSVTCHENKLMLIDFMKQKFFAFNVKDKYDLQPTRSIHMLKSASNIMLDGDDLLVAGYIRDGNNKEYELYILHLKDDSFTYLLPAEQKYGFDSIKDYGNYLRNNPDAAIIGPYCFADRNGEYAYFVWEGLLKISRIHVKTGKIDSFGKTFPHYVRPHANKKLIKLFKEQNVKLFKKERDRLSSVTGLFAGDGFVGLLYRASLENHKKIGLMLQLYSLDGTFLKERRLPRLDRFEYRYYFRKSDNTLFFLVTGIDEDDEDYHIIMKYKVLP